MFGPKEIFSQTNDENKEVDPSDDEGDDDDGVDEVKLRKYELNKLKYIDTKDLFRNLNNYRYFYAVVECTNVETAMKLYEVRHAKLKLYN